MYKFEFEHPSIDWDKVPVGSDVIAVIGGVPVQGKIQKDSDGDILICHNSTSRKISTDICDDKLGFKRAYSLGFDGDNLSDGDVIITNISEDEDFTESRVMLKVDGEDTPVIFSKGRIQVGCCTITNSQVEKIYENLIH